MRIIAGEHRGRRLVPPPGDATRPITDRVKQSLFDILTPLLPDARVYDCFAGTGSMGLECLSRGATHVTFFDADRGALAGLKQNIDALRVGDRVRVVPGNLFAWFASAANRPPDDRRTDLIFLDPPYRFLRERPDELRSLSEAMTVHHLAASGTLIFRHDAADNLVLPALRVEDTRTYGNMTLELMTPLPLS